MQKGKKEKWVKLPQGLGSQDTDLQKDSRNNLKGWSYLDTDVNTAIDDPNAQQVNYSVRIWKALNFFKFSNNLKKILKNPMMTLKT